MQIQQALLTINKYSRPGTKIGPIKNIVVHWVGNAGSKGISNRNYFESLKDKKTYASSHYIVGLDGEVILCVPETEIAYHATVANSRAIGIECCHPDWEGQFNHKTYTSLIELLADLCKRYNLNPQIDILRHYDITGKECPKYYVKNNLAWTKLKNDVAVELKKLDVDQELISAINKLIAEGVMMNACNWNSIDKMDLRYAETLILRIGALFGFSDYKATIDYLQGKEVITDRTLWDRKEFVPKYIRTILIRVSKLV
ncbi:N-acetylmuramoyl-L-alanine amidase [Sporanaerobium hydrogeniformans]|uniref:N-acetylmuramoyl-L-alanine amidase n=1 Tax=Sporanaerobium hydrogeniformans TaxID=3072179 RepID=A0AC61DAH8_9FIRM|nr:peptidoglycan recognition family protein [Sporanaerobium hydrogeniformans]PHV69788.1 N-acetylmuramoyl-L-alanine amidase [Sporanaerobium hydrogeniformans]